MLVLIIVTKKMPCVDTEVVMQRGKSMRVH